MNRQNQIDRILDKIHRDGMESLTNDERRILGMPIVDDTQAVDGDSPADWYFDVFVGGGHDSDMSAITLSRDGHNMDDSLGSHNLHPNILRALDRAGIFSEAELQESVWEVRDNNRTKAQIRRDMEAQGFVYSKIF